VQTCVNSVREIPKQHNLTTFNELFRNISLLGV